MKNTVVAPIPGPGVETEALIKRRGGAIGDAS